MSDEMYMFKLNGKRTLILIRKLRTDAPVKNDAVRCAWCHMYIARPVLAIVTQGVTVDVVKCMSYCPNCEAGTEYTFEVPAEDGKRKQLELPSSTR